MKIIKFASVPLIIFLSLYFIYIRFYDFIKKMDLRSPYIEKELVLENPQKSGAVTYIALGDSLSTGIGSPAVVETFPYQYGLKLVAEYNKVFLINLSQPGGTTLDVLTYQIPQALSKQPDYVTLLIGINDIHNKVALNEFESFYQNILDSLVNKTSANITVVNIPYLGAENIIPPPFNKMLESRTKQFNQVILNLVSRKNVNSRIKIVDLYSNTYEQSKKPSKYYSSDLFHPSGEGYLYWSKIINAD